MKDWGARIEVWGSRIEDRGSRFEDRGSRIRAPEELFKDLDPQFRLNSLTQKIIAIDKGLDTMLLFDTQAVRTNADIFHITHYKSI